MDPRPPTPSTEIPKRDSEHRFKETYTAAEWAEEYRPGGFHPVDIGTELKHGQYRVLRKLGYGAFSTVWLAVDTLHQRVVAVKVGIAKSADITKETSLHDRLKALDSTGLEIVRILETFEEVGPNGSHKCLVFEAMGPSVGHMAEDLPEQAKVPHTTDRHGERPCLRLRIAKRLLKDMLIGIDALHSIGVVHGDLQPGNLLMKIKPLTIDAASDLEQDVSGPRRIGCGWGLVERLDGKKDPWAPTRIYNPMLLTELVDLGAGAEGKLSDLGGAFAKESPPAKIITPIALRAPEVIFECKVDEKLDIWSFGCLLWEMLTGVPLFMLFPFGSSDDTLDDEHILMMIEVLGNLPPQFRARWSRGDRYLDLHGNIVSKDRLYEDEDAGESHHEIDTEPTSHELRAEDDINHADEEAISDTAMAPETGDEQTSAGEADAVDEDPNEDVEAADQPLPPLDQYFAIERQREIDDAESQQIVAVLRRMLQYNPEDRPSSRELLQDPWFQAI